MRLVKKLIKITFMTAGGLFAAFVAFGLMMDAGWISRPDKSSQTPAESVATTGGAQQAPASQPKPAATPAAPPRPSMPADEAQLVAAVRKFIAAYKAAPNDMAKGGTRPLRATEICKIGIAAVHDWQGTVETLSSNNDGNGVLAIRLSPELTVKTWNNAISDAGDLTLLKNGSKIYQQAVQLQTGQQVKFSGSFIASKADCIQEASLTVSGAMTEPEFLFRFSEVAPLE